MRVKMALFLVGLDFACQGCAPLWQSARTSLIEPFIYRRELTATRECRRNKGLAETAWADFFSKHSDLEYSKDFECGFKEGYADYLFWGGTGMPPPVPPRCYWNYKYETPQGHKAIQNWFAGFRAGAECAKQSGYRQLVLIPASTCLQTSSTQPAQSSPSSTNPVPGTLAEPGTSTEEMLPPPKPVPGTDKSSILGPPSTDSLPPPPVPSSSLEDELPALKEANKENVPPSASPLPAREPPLRPARVSLPEMRREEDQLSSVLK